MNKWKIVPLNLPESVASGIEISFSNKLYIISKCIGLHEESHTSIQAKLINCNQILGNVADQKYYL